jgi:hypothetical protein
LRGHESIKDKDVILTHVNLYDKTTEGLRHRHWPLFCVQYHPEAGPGPHVAGIPVWPLHGHDEEIQKAKEKINDNFQGIHAQAQRFKEDYDYRIGAHHYLPGL